MHLVWEKQHEKHANNRGEGIAVGLARRRPRWVPLEGVKESQGEPKAFQEGPSAEHVVVVLGIRKRQMGTAEEMARAIQKGEKAGRWEGQEGSGIVFLQRYV